MVAFIAFIAFIAIVCYYSVEKEKISMPTMFTHEPIMAAPDEQTTLHLLDNLLRAEQAGVSRFVGPNGDEFELPGSLLEVLKQLVHNLSQGYAISLVVRNQFLTTQQAADILNVSRPHLVRLLEEDHIPFFKTGKHRRIRLDDLMLYKSSRDAQRRRGLAELTRLGEQMGDYD